MNQVDSIQEVLSKLQQKLDKLGGERERLVLLLSVCRDQFDDDHWIHQETCSYACDSRYACDCGSLEFYSALNACKDIT